MGREIMTKVKYELGLKLKSLFRMEMGDISLPGKELIFFPHCPKFGFAPHLRPPYRSLLPPALLQRTLRPLHHFYRSHAARPHSNYPHLYKKVAYFDFEAADRGPASMVFLFYTVTDAGSLGRFLLIFKCFRDSLCLFMDG